MSAKRWGVFYSEMKVSPCIKSFKVKEQAEAFAAGLSKRAAMKFDVKPIAPVQGEDATAALAPHFGLAADKGKD